jgi:aminoglycoside phosphotransferase (APT) family kinase protein
MSILNILSVPVRRAATEPAEAEAIVERLRERAGCCLPESGEGSVLVRHLGTERRVRSRLYHFELCSGGRERRVVVKIPQEPKADPAGAGRCPQLAPLPEPHLSFLFEHTTLTAIQEHFRRLSDPRLGAVPLLDVLADERAIVMERVEGTDLRGLLAGACRLSLRRPDPRLEAAFHAAGLWLRAYQGCPPPPHAGVRHSRRAEVVQVVTVLAQFLGRETGLEPFFRGVQCRFAARARETLPDPLPLGLAHGDYAMRNILVAHAAGSERVTAIDTRGRWQAPVHEDAAYFLADLWTNRLQVLTAGMGFPRSVLERCERAFLEGYGEPEPVCQEALRLYQVPVLLDRWASRVRHLGQAGGRSRVQAHLELALVHRYYRKFTEELLRHGA